MNTLMGLGFLLYLNVMLESWESDVNCICCLFSRAPISAAQPLGPCSGPLCCSSWGREAGGESPEPTYQPEIVDGGPSLLLDCHFGRQWE